MARRVDIECGGDAREIDAKLKNKWAWNWLEKIVSGVTVFNFFRKLNKPGVALCVCEVSHAGKRLIQHAETSKSKHKSVASTRASN